MPVSRPEVLAPAGDRESLLAALSAGADAVYFGLDDGFNARARAANFPRAGLADTVRLVHDAGARAYLTLNTLIFQSELPAVAAVIRDAAVAGIDALIVQDPAVALLARATCPTLEVHASTQMTVSSPEAAAFCEALGITRVVVPRELSVEEIGRFAAGTRLELEVFVHGALCMSWSGQCLTSEAWGGRSANRGQCAQACRLPYDLVVDDEIKDLGDVRYLLSPKDLSGLTAVPELARLGVHGLKIEGRQKGPLYVGSATLAYRRAVDALGTAFNPAQDLENLALGYSRGLSPGFLRGVDHQSLVEGRFPEHRGVYLGRVLRVDGSDVVVRREARPGDLAPRTLTVTPGMGVVFDQGRPHENEPGGPVFRVEEGSDLRLGFGRPGPDLGAVHVGDRVFVTSDPGLAKRVDAQKRDAGSLRRSLPLELSVSGAAGAPLVVKARCRGHRAQAVSSTRLAPAASRGLDDHVLREKLGALGETRFDLASLDTTGLGEGLHLPVSELKVLRRAVVDSLTAALEAPRAISDVTAMLAASASEPRVEAPTALVPLVRTDTQLDVALDLGFPEIELDWMEMVGLGRAVERVRAAGRQVVVATVRVHKPGEEGVDARVRRLRPDGVLVRHLGALVTFSRMDPAERPALHGDFSLNVTNALTGRLMLDQGLDTLTAAHDLDSEQLFALVGAMPAHRVAVTLHHHIPTFHTEHCVYAHTLSTGRDFKTCGRPCETHRVGLRDPKGRVHPVVVDVGCRNTVFNAEAQSAPALAARLRAAGVSRLRVELVWEGARDAERVLKGWRQLMDGTLSPAALLERVGVHEQFGVTRGTMAVLGT